MWLVSIIVLISSLFWFYCFVWSIIILWQRQKCNNCDKVTIFDKDDKYCPKCWKNNID